MPFRGSIGPKNSTNGRFSLELAVKTSGGHFFILNLRPFLKLNFFVFLHIFLDLSKALW